ncbi:MAG: hypothetical protein E6G41_06540 [Actinobacteria bacterium]|nr:MAG: hypothetical protein E6G41_06540 [Actinomycetota bacterium]
MSSIKSLTTALVAAGAIAAPAASAMPASEPIAVSPDSSTTVVQAPAADNGFDWGDAGIGAGGVVAVALLALGGVATLRHRSMSPAS